MIETTSSEQAFVRYITAVPAPAESAARAGHTSETRSEIRSVLASYPGHTVRLRYSPKHPQPTDEGTETD